MTTRKEAIQHAQSVTPGPCPPWCELPAEHQYAKGDGVAGVDYDDNSDLIYYRNHKAAVWGALAAGMSIEQQETYSPVTGGRSLDADGPRVYFYAPSIGVDIFADASALEEIATDIMTAADRLREIARQS